MVAMLKLSLQKSNLVCYVLSRANVRYVLLSEADLTRIKLTVLWA